MQFIRRNSSKFPNKKKFQKIFFSSKALIDAHDRFKTVLEEARYDFDELKASDDSIKSLNMAANPYTWFTMETLFDTWKSLEKLIRV
jgi:hypothetical protein